MSQNESRARQDCVPRLQQLLSDELFSGAVLMINLENFSLITETFGQAYTKRLVEMIVQECERFTRGTVYRHTGANLVMILEGCSQETAQQVTDNISERFFNAWRIDGVDCACNFRGGVAFYPGHSQSVALLLSHLHMAVDESKKGSVNRFVLYDSTLDGHMEYRRRIARALPMALEDHAVEVRYRATFNVVTQRYERAECRLRMDVDGLGMVDAAEFMGLAEQEGYACEFGYYALQYTCALIRQLIRAGIEFESIAVPVSHIMFLQEDFPDRLSEIMRKFNIPRQKLGIEFEETMLIRTYPSVDTIMRELRDLGVELILRGFGTGFSGVDSVMRLPVDVLKLSRSLIWRMETEPRSCELVCGLIDMARRMNIKLIAAGVETENQYRLLESYGCVYEQGFYYTPTITAQALENLLPKKMPG